MTNYSDFIEKKTLAKGSGFSLIRTDKILVLSFMTLDMDLVMPDKMGGLCLVLKGRK